VGFSPSMGKATLEGGYRLSKRRHLKTIRLARTERYETQVIATRQRKGMTKVAEEKQPMS